MTPKIVKCPQCGVLAEYKKDNPARPFCSERCKLIDLGAWAEDRYAIAGAAAFEDISSLDALNDDSNATDAESARVRPGRHLDS